MEKGKESFDEFKQRVFRTVGPFFFDLEECIPTAAVSTSVMNRL